MISKLLIDNLSIRILLIVDNTFLSITRPSRRNHHRAHKLEAHTERRKFCSLVLSHEMSLHNDEVHSMPEKTKNEKVGIRFDNSQYLWQNVDPDAISARHSGCRVCQTFVRDLGCVMLSRGAEVGRTGCMPLLCSSGTRHILAETCARPSGDRGRAKTPKEHVKTCLRKI